MDRHKRSIFESGLIVYVEIANLPVNDLIFTYSSINKFNEEFTNILKNLS